MKEEAVLNGTQLLQLQSLLRKTVISNHGLKCLGYTKSQLEVFFALLLRRELTMTQVAGFIGSSKEQATRAVAPLVDDGLVERYIDTENRTRIHIKLTNAGKEFIGKWRDAFCQNLDESLDRSLTPEEKEELFRSMGSVIRILSKLD